MSLRILYEEAGEGVRILRCYGECREIALPEWIQGKKVTELGDYLFSEGMKEEPKGRWWTGESEEQQELKAQQNAGQAGEPVLCGMRVEAVEIPHTVVKIGRYAFYNCYGLRRLSFFSIIQDIGAGAFTGCRKIETLHVHVLEERRSCLKEILAELSEELTVEYCWVTEQEEQGFISTGEARLLFPVFYEEAVENTPARILETHVHGSGHRYRYAFEGTKLQFREYDSLFPWAAVQESEENAAALALGRLRYPLELSKEASIVYENFVLTHLEAAAACLLKEGGMEGWRWMIAKFLPETETEAGGKIKVYDGKIKVEHASAGCLGNEGLAVRAREEYIDIMEPTLGKIGLDKLIQISNQAGRTEVLSFLMDVSYRKFPPRRKQFEL